MMKRKDNKEIKDDFEESAKILKRALPMMVQNRIPASPEHYSVWYSYVAKDNLDLVREMDDTVANVGGCSEIKSEILYKKYIASEGEKKLELMKREIETLISDISSNLDDTTRGTDVFQLKLQKSFGKLSNVESGEMSLEETMAVLREVVKSSKEIAKNIDVFSLQLKKADSEINRLKQKIADIQKDANTDGLTNLLNSRAFDLELSHLIMIERPFSVIMGDIDRFKSLNDNYGHLMGDMALKAVASIFLNSNRDGSSSYRYGGEEFVMLLPDTKMVVARQIAESMRRKVEKLSIVSKETGTKINNVTSSFGVAEYQKGDDESELIERADKLLYEAKRLGRNRVMPLSM